MDEDDRSTRHGPATGADHLPRAAAPTRTTLIGVGNVSLRVYLRLSAWDEIRRFFGSADDKREVIGLLVGQAYQDGVGPFLLVEAALAAPHTETTSGGEVFTERSWRALERRLDRSYPRRLVVGSFRIRPGSGTALTPYDQFCATRFFPEWHHLLYVVDPLKQRQAMYHWKSERLHGLPGFWVWDESGDGFAHWPAAGAGSGARAGAGLGAGARARARAARDGKSATGRPGAGFGAGAARDGKSAAADRPGALSGTRGPSPRPGGAGDPSPGNRGTDPGGHENQIIAEDQAASYAGASVWKSPGAGLALLLLLLLLLPLACVGPMPGSLPGMHQRLDDAASVGRRLSAEAEALRRANDELERALDAVENGRPSGPVADTLPAATSIPPQTSPSAASAPAPTSSGTASAPAPTSPDGASGSSPRSNETRSGPGADPVSDPARVASGAGTASPSNVALDPATTPRTASGTGPTTGLPSPPQTTGTTAASDSEPPGADLLPTSPFGASDRYVVRQGDTLWSISSRLLGDPFAYKELARDNDIVNPDLILPGWELHLPDE